MPDTDYDVLAQDLAALGRGLPDPVTDPELVDVVMRRLFDVPDPAIVNRSQQWLRRVAGAIARHRRRLATVCVALVLSSFAAPPVRAAVADWFSFAGVIVHNDPDHGPSAAPPPPTAGTNTALEKAKRLVTFAPVVPTALGSPQGVEVSADRRLLSMSWTSERDGAVRLDQFDGRLDYTFAKTARGVEFTSVAGSFALWFDKPHEVVVLNPDGTRRTETARLAGHTLIWEHGNTALRLEGNVSRARAIAIATSVRAVP
jgi:hypothetical protein